MVLTAPRRAVGVLIALRGGLGFLSRLPIGHDERSWNAFRRQPAAFPLVGYVIGVLLAAPLSVFTPSTTAAAAFLVWVYLLTGVSHADAVTDLGDALATHGDREKRRSVMRDTAVGVGGVLALGLVLIGLALAAVQLAETALEGEIAAVLAVVVPRLPRLSNATDLTPLAREPGVRVAIRPPTAALVDADAVVLPGTKNTVDDLLALREAFVKTVFEYAGRERPAGGSASPSPFDHAVELTGDIDPGKVIDFDGLR